MNKFLLVFTCGLMWFWPHTVKCQREHCNRILKGLPGFVIIADMTDGVNMPMQRLRFQPTERPERFCTGLLDISSLGCSGVLIDICNPSLKEETRSKLFRELVAAFVNLGNYNAAQQYLQQVTGTDAESQDFIQYYTVLINAGLSGRDDYHLTKAEFAQLAPLMTHNSTVAENVKVLDHILNGVYHPLEAEPSTGSRPSERAEEGKDALMIDGLRVLPNPFDSELTFFSPEGTMILALSIFDISGKAVYTNNFGDAPSSVLLNTTSMPQGVLFYQCQLSDGKTLRGKIIHNSKK